MAFCGSSRDDGRTGLPAFRDEAPQAHIETAFGLASLPVALETLRFENGADVFLKHGGRRPQANDRQSGQDYHKTLKDSS